MPELSGAEQLILENLAYETPRRLCVDPRTKVFQARINGTPPKDTYTKGYYQVVFDTITLGTVGLIQPGMTIDFGTTSGARDIGSVRVRSATGTTIKIAETAPGELPGLADNMYISVIDEYRLWSVAPLLRAVRASNGLINNYTVLIDYETAYSNQNLEIPPIVNIIANPAGNVDDGQTYRTVVFTITTTPQASGRTPSNPTFDWVDGTVTAGPTHSTVSNVRTTSVTVRFPQSRYFRNIRVTGLDNNSNAQIKRFPIWVCGTTQALKKFNVTRDDTLILGGREMTFEFFGAADEFDQDAIPDDALVCYWEVPNSDYPTIYRDQYLGWPLSKTTLAKVDDKGRFSLPTAGPATWLDKKRGWAVRVNDMSTPTKWNELDGITNDRWTHMWLRLYSTFLTIFNLYPSGLTREAESEEVSQASLWAQIKEINKAYALTLPGCDSLGGMYLRPSYQTLSQPDRITRGELMSINSSNLRDTRGLEINDELHPRVGQMKGAGSKYTGDTSVQYKAIADGRTPGQSQSSQEAEYQRLPEDDPHATLREWLGDRIAMENNPRTGLTLPLIHNLDVVEPAKNLPIAVTWSHDTINGVELISELIIPTKVSIQHNNDPDKAPKFITITGDAEVSGSIAQADFIISNPNPVAPGPATQQPQIHWPSITVPQVIPPQIGINPVYGNGAIAFFGLQKVMFRTNDFYTPEAAGGPTYELVSLDGLATGYNGSVVNGNFCVDAKSIGTGILEGWLTAGAGIYKVINIFGTPVTMTQQLANTRSIKSIDFDYLHVGDIGLFGVCTCGGIGTDVDVYVTTDGGLNWNLVYNFGGGNNGAFVIIDPHEAGVFWTIVKDTADSVRYLYKVSNYGTVVTQYASITSNTNASGLHIPYGDPTSTRFFMERELTGLDDALYKVTLPSTLDRIPEALLTSGSLLAYAPRAGRWTLSTPSGDRRKLLVTMDSDNTGFKTTLFYPDIELSDARIVVSPPSANGYEHGVLLDPIGQGAILFGGFDGSLYGAGYWDGASVDNRGAHMDVLSGSGADSLVGVVGNG